MSDWVHRRAFAMAENLDYWWVDPMAEKSVETMVEKMASLMVE